MAKLNNMHPLTRRQFLAGASAIAVFPTPLWALPPSGKLNVDICIYGGTSGGVIAAVSLARAGRTVALVEPIRHLGGMTSGGLGWIDVKYGGHRAYGSLTGEYYRRIVQRYAAAGIDTKKYGNDGAVAEPHVAEAVLEEMLAEVKQHITIFRESRLASVKKTERRLQSITLDRAPVDNHGAPTATPQERNFAHITAKMFLDCSYEGDLLAAAGVPHRGDREGSAEYNEADAGIHINKTTEFDHPLHPVD
ncbi:MAG TPA: FAD-dependent oxidoreductase, partial [Terriglobus sp.]